MKKKLEKLPHLTVSRFVYFSPGAFQSLNGKVDLSEPEYMNTLEMYEEHLQSLREKSRLRVIASELTMATNPAVR